MAKYIVPILQDYIDKNNITTYIEPFCGGCNIIDKIDCKNKIASDINDDLICLLKYAQSDNNLSIAPEQCSFEHYSDVRADKNHEKYSQEYRALIGYMASYGGRYYDGGYGRDSKGGRSIYNERLANFKAQVQLLNDIEFECCGYKKYLNNSTKDSLFYLDPPYKSTKPYAKQAINYEEFYDYCRRLSENNIVVISEYNMPEDFECIWQKERSVLQKSDRVKGEKAVEKLFICGK